MGSDRSDQTIKLKDGRTLGYAEYGAPEGKPVFYFHGFPGSRLDWPLSDADDSAAELNARIVAVDRPGMGLSDFKRGREILDWPDDVIEMADVLQVDRFAVLGISGGGPYACACAYKIPERLTATAVVCGMGPFEAPRIKEGASWTIPGKPSVIRRMLLMLFAMGLRKNPDQFVSRSKEKFAEPDRLLLDQPEATKVYVDMLLEAFRSGIGGTHHEAALYTRPWRFRLQDIPVEIHLWHGELDLNVPVSVGRYIADAIPKCHATFLKDEAHISLPYNHIREILSILVA
ncbi:MAG TPA: alpha/beta hydrolase [Dehalococcoidales bacterium]|nr:alpha/beta hydrolase [Dehalococcoidales bacterium]